jgi:hypothetical protein
MDGVLLSMSQDDLARNVVQLVESGVQLPEWWIYGRKPGKRPPSLPADAPIRTKPAMLLPARCFA